MNELAKYTYQGSGRMLESPKVNNPEPHFAVIRDAEPAQEFPTVRQIIEQVAVKHGFTYAEMIANRRPKIIMHARQEAYWRCMKETIVSLPVIGKNFGGRDHTTILVGARKHQERMEKGV